MDFMILSVVIFIVSLIVIELCLYAYRHSVSNRNAKIKKRLRKYTFVEDDFGGILKRRDLSEIPFLNNILLSLPFVKSWDNLVMQANAKHPVGFYMLMSFLLGALGALSLIYFFNNILLALGVALLLMYTPYLYLKYLKDKRIQKFKQQLHEGLDLIARALRAGHSFTSSMKLAADEFGDPLGIEFEETLDEINFGVSVPVALRNLSQRVDCKEINYFVVAVIIQRDTGGNLAELIESLAHIVRETFKFEGKVRILSAEGRLSGVVLCLIPFFIGLWLQISSPGFIKPLFTEPIGRILLGVAGVMMIIGMFVIKKIVKIEV